MIESLAKKQYCLKSGQHYRLTTNKNLNCFNGKLSDSPEIWGSDPLLKGFRVKSFRGRSSVVEYNLAKVGVEGSNPFARFLQIVLS